MNEESERRRLGGGDLPGQITGRLIRQPEVCAMGLTPVARVSLSFRKDGMNDIARNGT